MCACAWSRRPRWRGGGGAVHSEQEQRGGAHLCYERHEQSRMRHSHCVLHRRREGADGDALLVDDDDRLHALVRDDALHRLLDLAGHLGERENGLAERRGAAMNKNRNVTQGCVGR